MLGVGTQRVTPPTFGIWSHHQITFLVVTGCGYLCLERTYMVGWIEFLYSLDLPMVGKDKGLVGYDTLLEWVCLGAPVYGWVKGIHALDIHLVGQDEGRGGFGTLLE